MMKKRLSKTIWYGSEVDNEGNPIVPELAKDSEDLEGIHHGELYLHEADDKLSLWARTLTNQVKPIVGLGGGGDLWKLMETETGEKYLFTELNIVTQMGLTSFASVKNLDLPSIYDGLPIDGQTLRWKEVTDEDGSVTRVLESVGGGTGEGNGTISSIEINGTGNAITSVTLSEDKTGLIFTKDKNFIDSEYLQENYLNKTEISNNYYNKGYIDENLITKDGASELFVTLDETQQDINGVKNFVGELQVNGNPIVYNSAEGYWMLDGDLLVTGDITSFANENGYTPSSIMDALRVDGTNLKVIDGVLTFVGSTGGGGGVAEKVTWANIEGKPTWIGESKPSYSWTEITGKPNFVTEEDLEEEGFLTAMDIQVLTFTSGAFKALSYDPSMAPKTVNIPTKLSHLEDDSAFATKTWVGQQGFATKTWVGQQGFATEDWVDENYFSINGGQLHGDLWLRSGTESYGRRIIFGDVRTSNGQPYVYIGEDTDDDLTIASWGDFRIKVGDGAYLTYIKDDGYWEITGDLLVTGGITSYA